MMKIQNVLGLVLMGLMAGAGTGAYADTGTVVYYRDPISGKINGDTGNNGIQFYKKDMVSPVKVGDRVSFELHGQIGSQGEVLYFAEKVTPIPAPQAPKK